MKFPQEKYLKDVELFDNFLKEVPKLMDESGETFSSFGEKLSISRGAVSNKKTGKRLWKLEELKTLVRLFNREQSIVENYIFILMNLNTWLSQYLEFQNKKKIKFLDKIDLNYQKLYTRENRYTTDAWKMEDVKIILEHLDFEQNALE